MSSQGVHKFTFKESSAPGARSPFGHTHDSSGRSGKVSATGNSKWRAFRRGQTLATGGPPVPGEYGGLRTSCINAQVFARIQEAAECLGLHNDVNLARILPGCFRDSTPGFYDTADRRAEERDLFKRILAGVRMPSPCSFIHG